MVNIEPLLYESEGNSLDFKSEQYHFEGSSDNEKSELLKDIVAFANAWRRESAVILIGVKDTKNGKAEIVGINSDIDDSRIQQFINSKTNRPIAFHYSQSIIDGKKIGIIEIPVQQRPFCLKTDYGKLKSDIVYLRRGSSTAIASIDEIAGMGHETKAEVKIDINLYDKEKRISLGKKIVLESIYYVGKNRQDIPYYTVEDKVDSMGLPLTLYGVTANSNYYREVFDYVSFNYFYKEIAFELFNSCEECIRNIRIKANYDVEIFSLKKKKPTYPKKTNPLYIGPNIYKPSMEKNRTNISIEESDERIELEIKVEDILPGEKIVIDNIYIGSKKTCNCDIEYLIFAENISNPIKEKILHNSTAIEKTNITEQIYKF